MSNNTSPRRKTLWQLGALAAAAGALCVAQAQNIALLAESTQPAESAEVVEGTESVVEATTPSTETTAPASTEAPVADTTTATTAQPDTKRPADHTVVVTPQPAAPVAAAEPAAPAEPRLPTREEVIAEAVYANENGLIPRGEVAVLHEDKGMVWAEQMAQQGDLPQRFAMR